ncbi:hypothetical protein HWV62_23957 [Athelia sp. TMB]|nr:hypothetical protein HWV62_23957 [Athelia sp. TMB]
MAHTNQTTPSERIGFLPNAKKALVRTAAPRGGRCLVENIAEDYAVEFVHYIPRSLSWRDSEMMSNLEWWWNISKNTLNFDTRHNIFPLGTALHILFSKNEWLLLPEEHVVDSYYTKCRRVNGEWETERASFSPNIEPVFLYTLVPMPSKMTSMWISRLDTIPTANSPLQASHVSTHVHPFQTLPLLNSHLRPHFVIFEAGRRLQALSPIVLFEFMRQNPLLEKIACIYHAWVKIPPEGAEKDESFVPPSPPSDEYSETDEDENTQAHRRARGNKQSRPQTQSLVSHNRKKRKLGNQRKGADYTSDVGKRKRAHNSAPSLSREILRNHLVDEEKMWTADSIRAWSENNSVLEDDSQPSPE